MDEFEIVQCDRFLLMRNGKPVVDENGQPRLYESRDEAEFVASTWAIQRAPTYGELAAMPDDEVRFRGGL